MCECQTSQISWALVALPWLTLWDIDRHSGHTLLVPSCQHMARLLIVLIESVFGLLTHSLTHFAIHTFVSIVYECVCVSSVPWYSLMVQADEIIYMLKCLNEGRRGKDVCVCVCAGCSMAPQMTQSTIHWATTQMTPHTWLEMINERVLCQYTLCMFACLHIECSMATSIRIDRNNSSRSSNDIHSRIDRFLFWPNLVDWNLLLSSSLNSFDRNWNDRTYKTGPQFTYSHLNIYNNNSIQLTMLMLMLVSIHLFTWLVCVCALPSNW